MFADASEGVPAADRLCRKYGLPITVRGRLRCLGRLGSTGLIAGDSTGMAGTDWEVFEETPLAATGLKLQQVPIEAVQQALQDSNNTEADLGNVDLARWQPDFILVLWKRKRIAVVDLTRPSDVLSAQLEEGYRSKKRRYGPVRSALHHYIREGWTMEILPWVIGIRGLTDTASLQKAL